MEELSRKERRERFLELVSDEPSMWIHKARHRRRWRWLTNNKFILKLRFQWAKIKIYLRNFIT